MADSLTPWLLSHLLDAAETYGAQISNIPLHDKTKKVQITEFLTFGSEEQDTYIWARVSDKKCIIPIKFSKEAVAEFRKIASRRLTQHKGAIVTIKKFRVISSRLPLDGGKPTTQSHLALECDSVRLLGSAGEPTFGNPKPVTVNPDLQLWSEGLNQAGGAGNILKERKEQRDREAEQIFSHFERNQMSMPPPPLPPLSPRPQVDVNVKGQTVPLRRTKVTDMASYHARWQIVEKNIQYRNPPEENDTDSAAPIQVEAPSSPVREKTPSKELSQVVETNPSRSRSATPIASWDQSPTSKLVSSPVPDNKPLSIEYTNTTSSSLVPPTPAQRTKRPTITPEEPSSSYPATANESILDIEVDIPEDVDGAQVRPQVSRKVPRPTSPQPRRHTGPARVLVPNSDTSGTQSQSLSLTQPSQSLSLPQPLESDARVGSSLPNNALREADEVIRGGSDDDISIEADHEREEVDEERVRRSLTMSPEAESISGKSPSPEKSVHGDGDGRRYADDSESDGGSGSETGSGDCEERDGTEMEEDELEADGSDDGYPWMTLWSVRGVIVKADALRRSLHNTLVT